MRKVLSIALAAMLLCSLAACKGKEPAADQSDPVTTTEEPAEDVEAEPAEETEAPAETTAEDEGRILRYGISVPAERPEFEESFYFQPLEFYTDDVLAENRDRLEAAPAGTKTETLNRFTEYLNAVEPGEHTDSVQMLWLYTEVYDGNKVEEPNYARLIQVPAPIFEGGRVEWGIYGLPGSKQEIYMNNSASDEDADFPDNNISFSIYTDSSNYDTAEHALESHMKFLRDGLDYNRYDDYDEDTKTSVWFTEIIPSEGNKMSRHERGCTVFQTIAEGYALKGEDVLMTIEIALGGEPKLSEADVKVLHDYFEYTGIKFPDDALWGIQ